MQGHGEGGGSGDGDSGRGAAVLHLRSPPAGRLLGAPEAHLNTALRALWLDSVTKSRCRSTSAGSTLHLAPPLIRIFLPASSIFSSTRTCGTALLAMIAARDRAGDTGSGGTGSGGKAAARTLAPLTLAKYALVSPAAPAPTTQTSGSLARQSTSRLRLGGGRATLAEQRPAETAATIMLGWRKGLQCMQPTGPCMAAPPPPTWQ